MDSQEFITKRDKNSTELKLQIKEGRFDLMKFYGFDADPGIVGRWILASKTHDILGAIYLGFLPILNSRKGVDAMKLEDGIIKPVELKSTYTDTSKLIKTENDAIYSVTQDKVIDGAVKKDSTTSFKSNFNATYKIVGNLEVKGIDTYLLIIDERTDALIDVYMMEGKIIAEYLADKKIPKSSALQIKMTIFEKLGKIVTDTIMPTLGFTSWKDSLLPCLPLVKVVSKSRKSKIPSPILDFVPETKIDPIEQLPSPYTEALALPENLDLVDIQPTSPYAKF